MMNFRKEHDSYQGAKTQKKRRVKRNHARRLLGKLGMMKKGDMKEMDNKDHNPMNNHK